jgi:hypothetical protein
MRKTRCFERTDASQSASMLWPIRNFSYWHSATFNNDATKI